MPCRNLFDEMLSPQSRNFGASFQARTSHRTTNPYTKLMSANRNRILLRSRAFLSVSRGSVYEVTLRSLDVVAAAVESGAAVDPPEPCCAASVTFCGR